VCLEEDRFVQEQLQGSGSKKYRLVKGSFQEELFSGLCEAIPLKISLVLGWSLILVLAGRFPPNRDHLVSARFLPAEKLLARDGAHPQPEGSSR
jgi:hypothetical protein